MATRVGGGDDATVGEEIALVHSMPGRPHVTWTDRAGQHSLFLEARTLAGAAPEAKLVVVDPTVSRLHAELEVRGDGVWVRDLGSKNGTYVEGVLVSSARVPRRGNVRLGSALLRFRESPSNESIEVWTAPHFHGLLGASIVMRKLFALIARVAKTDSSVLVHGETGTGKELVARAIHDASPRAGGPFVVVDCAAIPEMLLESQLFGHTKGSFTGATAARTGDIEAAEGGTVFLDEIGELPIAMQPKLLRAVEARSVKRVGETHERRVDVRFVSATHRDLRVMVNAGAFREDLYFRLGVVPLEIPPLRERAEDIAAILARFLPEGSGAALSTDLLAELTARPWLGNVRELRNFAERVLALGAHAALSLTAPAAPGGSTPAPLPATPSSPASLASPGGVALEQPFRDFRNDWVDQGEREYVRALLARHGRNVTEAAAAAGLDRTYVHRLMRKHGL